MSQISRLKAVEIANGNLINADDLNAEFDQLVDESNGQDTRLSSIENGTATLPGIKINAISESTSGNGVRVDGARLHDGVVNPRPILSPIASIDVNTDQITSSVAHGLSTGDSVGIGLGSASAAMPGGLSETMTYYARVVSSTVIALHPTEPDAQGGTNTVGITTTGSGTLNLIHDPGTPTPGDIWVNQEGALKYQSGNNAYTVMDRQGRYLARYETHSAAPVYKTSTTFTIDHIASRDWGNAYNIVNDAPVTVDVSTAGINGLVQFTAAGTVSVTSGTNTVTVTSGVGGFAIGDVITTNGGQVRQVSSVDGSGNPTQVSSNWTATETSVAFKYGGRCANTWYYVYETISFGFVGILLSVRNQAGGQSLDFSTTAFRQMPFAIRLDNNANILPFYVTAWGERPTVFFRDFETAPSYGVLTSGTSTAAFTNPGGGANIDLSALVPKISKEAILSGQMSYVSGSGTWSTNLKSPESASLLGMQVAVVNSVGESIGQFTERVPINSSQQLAYRVSGQSVTMYCRGFTVTEVF